MLSVTVFQTVTDRMFTYTIFFCGEHKFKMVPYCVYMLGFFGVFFPTSFFNLSYILGAELSTKLILILNLGNYLNIFLFQISLVSLQF